MNEASVPRLSAHVKETRAASGDLGDVANAFFAKTEAAIVFVHAEPQDEADPSGLETKFVKNVEKATWNRSGRRRLYA
jgi:hypothetical protein